jgi:succinate dehydrogenase / fumarate reductase membrane anchor subunit
MMIRNQIKQRHGSAVLHWRWQRISSIVMLPLMIYCVYLVAGIISLDYMDAHAFVGAPTVALPLAILLVSGIYHAVLGLQVVIEDYVALSSGRRGLIMSARFALGGTALVSLASLALITF